MATRAWRLVGERAVLRTFPDTDTNEANRRALACRDAIAALTSPDVEDLVPGARSILVVLRAGAAPPQDVLDTLEAEAPAHPEPKAGRSHDMPVNYGGDAGPDLAAVAAHGGMTEADVIAAHSGVEYVVGFVGFSPGFGYLLGMDPALATPRLETPRLRVPPGSVGIGGGYTGVYPSATPGGWRLIGRTDVELFDPGRDPPALLAPGDRVRFFPR